MTYEYVESNREEYAIRGGSTVYMCGHSEYLVRRDGQRLEASVLSWPDAADELVNWLNAQPPFDDTVADGSDEFQFTLVRRAPCGHLEFWLYRSHRPGHVVFAARTIPVAARLTERLDEWHRAVR